ncbi:purine or other phosphorylase family 1 [Paenibacillus curdlanolyticus YK9]|uniref:Purine or other phosphorylase family 1 n=1 Tax=Paenibacillus curdlanolyticus YK9 TaxID=717606 RepID=E0I321_9BACL|nr:purine or other phosphorylase family 1 [Paenibacillus curdlanolyticus]EFM12685.1 purine or other phosphorylase family 1 [Paenibacillus curdlanolyticus YK9]
MIEDRYLTPSQVMAHRYQNHPRPNWTIAILCFLVKELTHLGVETIIGYGAAGSINRTMKQGALALGAESLNSDGTSRTYLPERHRFSCDPALLDIAREVSERMKLEVHEAIAANIDGLFRETKTLVRELQAEGAQMVNLETSALYASAEICKARSTWLGFISDRLVQEEWESWDIDSSALSTQVSLICLGIVKQWVSAAACEVPYRNGSEETVHE